MLTLPTFFADLVGRLVVTRTGADGAVEEHDVPMQLTDAEPAPLPMPIGMRGLLLDILSLGYPSGAVQTRLGNAPDAAIAWQVQSMLDDYSSYEERAEGWWGLEA